MNPDDVQILCTRPLDDHLLQSAAPKHIQIDIVPFIETVEDIDPATHQFIHQLESQEATIVFTSMNAVDAVGKALSTDAKWKIYCIGTATKELVTKYFGSESIVGSADDARSLAAVILNDKSIKRIDFFCGNQRREEMPLLLRESGIEVNEVVVYNTIELKNKIDKEYDGIAFFSPSAVRSFFQLNSAGEETLIFAIGNTTAEEVRKYSANSIIISDNPGKEKLIETIIRYYNKQQVQE